MSGAEEWNLLGNSRKRGLPAPFASRRRVMKGRITEENCKHCGFNRKCFSLVYSCKTAGNDYFLSALPKTEWFLLRWLRLKKCEESWMCLLPAGFSFSVELVSVKHLCRHARKPCFQFAMPTSLGELLSMKEGWVLPCSWISFTAAFRTSPC